MNSYKSLIHQYVDEGRTLRHIYSSQVILKGAEKCLSQEVGKVEGKTMKQVKCNRH